jgi:hypothetical protein
MMMAKMVRRSGTVLVLLTLFYSAGKCLAEDATIAVADGKLTLKAPADWTRKKPTSGIVEHEFAITKSEGDAADGRMTVMGAGGSVDANIERWLGQFLDADGKKLTKDKAKIDKKKVAGEDVTIVDISGTYLDKPGGPFTPGPPVERKNYRMLAGVVATKNLGNYFFKFYGPEKTVEANEDAFLKMLNSLEKK